EEELKNHLAVLEERKARDHRKLGKELGIFMFDELVGRGLPMWLHPKKPSSKKSPGFADASASSQAFSTSAARSLPE
ncbi:MAG: hypothetical protein IJL87_01420, partial [Clostridia bacterium]|nr:hypothetical protein [Clostridia bacterium]